MKIVKVAPIGAPQDAEALQMSLWQSDFDFAAPITLWIFGEGKQGGNTPLLGVSARNPAHELCGQELIADTTGGEVVGVLEEEMLSRAFELAPELVVINLIPRRRNLRMADPNYWGAKFDPLGEVFATTGKLGIGTVAGVAVTVSPRRDGRARIEVRAFGLSATRNEALSAAQRIAREYATIGVVPRVSARARHHLRNSLVPRVSYFRSRVRDPKEVAAFWHPPYRTAEQRAAS
jgi:hypothetical protein